MTMTKPMPHWKKEWLAVEGDLPAIIEYAQHYGDNDVYNAAMMLRTYLLKKDSKDA